jgi:hypothetical protein
VAEYRKLPPFGRYLFVPDIYEALEGIFEQQGNFQYDPSGRCVGINFDADLARIFGRNSISLSDPAGLHTFVQSHITFLSAYAAQEE